MNIAIIITNFEGGGAQRVALTEARELQKRGYTIHVWALEHQEDYALPEDLIVDVLSSARGESSKLRKLITALSLPFTLARRVRNERIDVCVSHLERADFVNILARPLGGHRSVGVIHSHLTANYQQEGYTLRSRLYLWLVKRLEQFQSCLVAVSQEIAINLRDLGLPPDRIEVIHNPFPVEEIREQSQKDLGIYEPLFSGPTLISTGRISRQKGFWHVLHSLPYLKYQFSGLSYLIVGDGPLRYHHIEVARKLGLSVYVSEGDEHPLPADYDVYVLGFLDNPFRLIARADALVLPSHYEGLPNVLIESLICGTPVIATDSQAGPRELLAPETDVSDKTETLDVAEYGLLTPLPDSRYHEYHEQPSDSASDAERILYDAMFRMLSDDELRETYQTKSARRVEEFRTEHVIPQWVALLKELTQHPS